MTININKAVNLREEIGGFGDNPGVYLAVTSFDSSRQCFSRCQSSTVYLDKNTNTIRWPESEQLLICMGGSDGHIVMNVLSSTILSGDKFLGQVVLDMKDRREEIDGQSPYFDVSAVSKRFMSGDKFTVNIPIIGTTHFPLCDKTGGKCKMIYPRKVADNGQLKLTLSMPSIFSSLCGSFHQKSTSLFGIIDTQEVWVIMHKSRLKVYDNKFAGEEAIINTIDIKDIFYLDDYNVEEGEVVDIQHIEVVNRGGIRFKVKKDDNLGLTSYDEETVWLWDKDTSRLKGLWKNVLSRHCLAGSWSSLV